MKTIDWMNEKCQWEEWLFHSNCRGMSATGRRSTYMEHNTLQDTGD